MPKNKNNKRPLSPAADSASLLYRVDLFKQKVANARSSKKEFEKKIGLADGKKNEAEQDRRNAEAGARRAGVMIREGNDDLAKTVGQIRMLPSLMISNMAELRTAIDLINDGDFEGELIYDSQISRKNFSKLYSRAAESNIVLKG